ncbi:unnamed protein product [Bemisia tabaci]|uniref:Gelsolin-related protein n=1 Tax=Bemisia tabaci TaxID=7038 RepID=A0A7S5HGL8_BEMTA|nr:PREDICTED: gelsolin-related protein of 125 kDa-like [Bemisia tabaci]QHB15560.1 gelsolin-related protein [Bemisia tabaci]CAH0390667.1 unnamed protein product [Bemisia tabaci]
MAATAETVPETVAAPEKETEQKEEVSKSDVKEVKDEEPKEVAEEKNGHSESDEGKKNGVAKAEEEKTNGITKNDEEKNHTEKTNGTTEENESEEVSDACPVKRKSEAADIPDSKVSEEDAVSCEKKAKIEEKLAAAKGEEVLNSEEAEATA